MLGYQSAFSTIEAKGGISRRKWSHQWVGKGAEKWGGRTGVSGQNMFVCSWEILRESWRGKAHKGEEGCTGMRGRWAQAVTGRLGEAGQGRRGRTWKARPRLPRRGLWAQLSTVAANTSAARGAAGHRLTGLNPDWDFARLIQQNVLSALEVIPVVGCGVCAGQGGSGDRQVIDSGRWK